MIRLAVDRTHGSRFVDLLRAGGLEVTTMADVWGEGAAERTDLDWIRWAGARRRVTLTADDSVHFLRAKREAIQAVRLQIFAFPHGTLTVDEQANRVLALRGAMERLVTERPGPWVAVLYDHRVAVTWPSPDPGPGPAPNAAASPPDASRHATAGPPDATRHAAASPAGAAASPADATRHAAASPPGAAASPADASQDSGRGGVPTRE